MWFRIVLAKDGAIRSCDLVSQSYENSESVLYIEADSKERAVERARKHWKKRYRSRVYHERKRLGVCVACMDQALPDSTFCAFHKKKQSDSQRRIQRKKKSLGLKHTDRIPPEHNEWRNIDRRNYGGNPSGLLNLRTLLIVQENHRRLSERRFAEWLQERIDEYRAQQHRVARTEAAE